MQVMRIRLNHFQLLRSGGLVVWALVGIPLVLTPFMRGLSMPLQDYFWWTASHLGFGLAWWWLVRDLKPLLHDRTVYLILLVLTACALGVGLFSLSGLGAILLVVLSGVLPWVLHRWQGLAWVAAAHAALFLVFRQLPDTSITQAAMLTGVFLGFSGFVFLLSLFAREQFQAREQLRATNAQLQATRGLLADSSRMAERLRIARDLHDVIGHHLTALSLNLEVASHQEGEAAREQVRRAQEIARSLLSDVRQVVSDLREEDQLDLGEALRHLVAGITGLRVQLHQPASLHVPDPALAQEILRLVQEGVTNCIRHARARNLWIQVHHLDRGIHIHLKDDGVGQARLQPGNGLQGMRERVEQRQGWLRTTTAPGEGFELEIFLPLNPSAMEHDHE